jgi:thioredoxin 1
MNHATTANSDDFYSIIASDTPTLIDFWAEWCGPCRAVSPVLEAISEERDGSLLVAKLNVDDHPDVARDFGVMSIPTMIIFESGDEKKRLVGARSKEAIDAELAEIIF